MLREIKNLMVKYSAYYSYCSVCGEKCGFADMAPSVRESFQCDSCRASLRERVVAEAIISVFGRGKCNSVVNLICELNFAKLKIFEPGISGAIRKILSDLPNYQNLFYYPGHPMGSLVDGIRNENLEELTFSDNTFDLVITSDIFEHIRHPWQAFKEIHRVLIRGGVHIFSIPGTIPLNDTTRARVDVSDSNDVHILEPIYHGDGKGGESLVYNDFGSDIFQNLLSMGFHTVSVRNDHVDNRRRTVFSYISIAV